MNMMVYGFAGGRNDSWDYKTWRDYVLDETLCNWIANGVRELCEQTGGTLSHLEIDADKDAWDNCGSMVFQLVVIDKLIAEGLIDSETNIQLSVL